MGRIKPYAGLRIYFSNIRDPYYVRKVSPQRISLTFPGIPDMTHLRTTVNRDARTASGRVVNWMAV